MMETRDYEQLALESGVYKDIELDILIDTLESWKSRPGSPFSLVEVRDSREPAGFCLFQRASNTTSTFDIHTFLVGRDYKGKGAADKLLELLTEEILSSVRSAMIRVEVSSMKENAVEPGFFTARGFEILGHIPDFYGPGNDYWIYAKQVNRI
ncbi:MAG: GNAT family N-acetyltransferase [Treponema sp.]|nr:GNAT family N-acetyltransferase [Treponema sp.]